MWLQKSYFQNLFINTNMASQPDELKFSQLIVKLCISKIYLNFQSGYTK